MKVPALVAAAALAVFALDRQAVTDEGEFHAAEFLHKRLRTPIEPVHGRIPDSNATTLGRCIPAEAVLVLGEEEADEQPAAFFHQDSRNDEMEPLLGEPRFQEVVAALAGIAPEDVKIDPTAGTFRVPADAVAQGRTALERLRASLPPVVDLSLSLEVVADGGKPRTLLSVQEPVDSEIPRVFVDATDRSVIADYDVEIAQACVIANPVVNRLRTGASAVLRVRPLPDASSVVVEVVARAAEEIQGEPIDPGHPGFGSLARCACRIEEGAATFLIGNGETVSQTWTGREGRSLRLKLTARWPQARARGGEHDALGWSALVDRPILGFGNARLPFGTPDGALWPPLALDLRRLASRPDLANAVASRIREVSCSVRAVQVRPGEALEPEKPVPAGGVEWFVAEARMLSGVSACFNTTRCRRYLQDWDVEVAQAARIPDPNVSSFEDGQLLDLRVDTDADGKPRTVRLDLEVIQFEGLDRELAALDVAQSGGGVIGSPSHTPSGGGGGSDISSIPAMPQDVVAIERPRLRRLRIAGTFPLDSNGLATIRRSVVSGQQSGELVLFVTAR